MTAMQEHKGLRDRNAGSYAEYVKKEE